MTRIDDIKARLDAATDGPWWDESGVIHAKAPHWTPEVHSCDHVAKADPHENATFIANAPADIAYLLRLVEELDESLDRLMIVQPQQCWCHELDPDDIDDGCECQMCYAAAARKRAEEPKT